jgi:hypothetical protein
VLKDCNKAKVKRQKAKVKTEQSVASHHLLMTRSAPSLASSLLPFAFLVLP